MKDAKEVFIIMAIVLTLGIIAIAWSSYYNNTGTGLLAEQMRLAQAYPDQVQHVETMAKANATNAQADVYRSQAETTRLLSIIWFAVGAVVVLLLCVGFIFALKSI